MGSGLLIDCSALMLAAVTGARPLTIALVAVWGLGFGAVPVAAQSWMARAMPANVEGGLALFVSALQGSLAAGSAAGGVIYDAKGPGGALVVAAAVAAAGSLALLGRAGAAINSPPAGSAGLVRARGQEAPAPPRGDLRRPGQAGARPGWTNRQSGLSAVRNSTAAVLMVAEAVHGSAASGVPKLTAAGAAELHAVWSLTPAVTVLSQSSPRFTFGS
jgi:hypothetical protein